MLSESLYRWILLVVVVIGLTISIYFRRKADRAGGSVNCRGDAGWIRLLLTVSGVTGFGGLLMYLVNPAWMGWSQIGLPDWARLPGGALGLFAVALFLWVFRSLGDNVTATALTRTNHTLVTGGPYRWVRHPMYFSGLLLFGSYVLLTDSWFILLTCGVAFGALIVRTSQEEANLTQRFGDEYREYARETGRFLPRSSRRRDTAVRSDGVTM